MKIITDKQELPIIMDAGVLRSIGFSRGTAYTIMNRADAPTITIGKRKFVERDKFFDWLEALSQNNED